jgi:hypothetical protein
MSKSFLELEIMKMNEKHFLLTFPTLECAEPTSPTRLSSPKSSQLRVRSLPQVFTKRPRSRLCRRVQLVLTLVSLQQGLHARFTFTSPPVMSSKSSEKSEKHCNELSGASRLAEAHMFVHFASSPFCAHNESEAQLVTKEDADKAESRVGGGEARKTNSLSGSV